MRKAENVLHIRVFSYIHKVGNVRNKGLHRVEQKYFSKKEIYFKT